VTVGKTKTFDAVDAKWRIQQQLDEEYAGMDPDATREAQRRRIEDDPVLGPFLKRVRRTTRGTAPLS
jgi:hypothetical protein